MPEEVPASPASAALTSCEIPEMVNVASTSAALETDPKAAADGTSPDHPDDDPPCGGAELPPKRPIPPDAPRSGIKLKINDLLDPPEMQVVYYGYRHYDPVTGRWPSRDPIGEKGGLNIYAMNYNDLIMKVDYMGRETLPSGKWKLRLPPSNEQIEKRRIIKDQDETVVKVKKQGGRPTYNPNGDEIYRIDFEYPPGTFDTGSADSESGGGFVLPGETGDENGDQDDQAEGDQADEVEPDDLPVDSGLFEPSDLSNYDCCLQATRKRLDDDAAECNRVHFSSYDERLRCKNEARAKQMRDATDCVNYYSIGSSWAGGEISIRSKRQFNGQTRPTRYLGISEIRWKKISHEIRER